MVAKETISFQFKQLTFFCIKCYLPPGFNVKLGGLIIELYVAVVNGKKCHYIFLQILAYPILTCLAYSCTSFRKDG
ncbi:hypothetical protein [Methanosarcina sp. DH2]|jgi:hypothetical protein|uniref:hypothetical protein n=1 Tax=Methanosarcina sp. DH2 TaxID=2605639 RepID=UPI001E5E7D80|nr:hypothetical protein [Methanosarcina sp. DH2]